jgi:hypothetical protein
MPPKASNNKKEIPWTLHPAREFLKNAFMDGTIPLDWDGSRPEDIYAQFAGTDAFRGLSFDRDEFSRRLKSLQAIVTLKKDRVILDKIAFDTFRENFPVREHNDIGDLRWNGSLAERFLKEDMKAGLHDGLTPLEFRESRVEYQEFSVERFRKHIDQEKRLWKMENYLRELDAKKEAKQAAAYGKALKVQEKAQQEKATQDRALAAAMQNTSIGSKKKTGGSKKKKGTV